MEGLFCYGPLGEKKAVMPFSYPTEYATAIADEENRTKAIRTTYVFMILLEF